MYDAKVKMENNIPKKLIILGETKSMDGLKDFKEKTGIPVEIKKEQKSKPVYKNIAYNRRWQILEKVRKNQPTTSSAIANQLGIKHRTVYPTLKKLANNQWLKRGKNTMFDNNKIKYVYYIGSQGKDFLKTYDGFLYPSNPYDPLEDGTRREKVIKKKAKKING